MSTDGTTLIRWTARVAGALVCVLLAAFAIDAIGDGFSSLMMHLLPALVAIAVVVLAWRWEIAGGTIFLGLAVLYAFVARDHVSWIVAIALPLAVVGLLFVISGRGRGLTPANR